MADIDMQDLDGDFVALRRRVRRSGHVQRAKMMALAAMLSGFGIIAVAAAMMTTLL